MARAVLRDMHVVQVQVDQALVQIVDAGITHRRQDAPEVRVAGKKGRLHQRRMGDRVGHLAAFGDIASAIDLHGDELRRAFAVAHDGLRQLLRHVEQRLRARRAVAAVEIAESCALPAWCVAMSTKESLVEVSPSMVMRLKDSSAASFTSACISPGAMAASVAMKPSIVAMFGRIMPAPLVMPVIVTVLPPKRAAGARPPWAPCRWS